MFADCSFNGHLAPKFDMLVQYGPLRSRKNLISIKYKMADGAQIRHTEIVITLLQTVRFRINMIQSLIS